MMTFYRRFCLVFLVAIISAASASCSGEILPTQTAQKVSTAPAVTMTPVEYMPLPTSSLPIPTVDEEKASPTAILTATATPDLRLRPESWQLWPIIPDLSPEMIAVYQKGIDLGRDPHFFSVIGDCQSSPTYFLSMYDEGRYTLSEEETNLQETIEWYEGSFSHRSVTVTNGMTAPGALNSRWADESLCESGESPLVCEIRLSNPSLVLISLGTNWHPSTSQEQYILYLTEIVETLLEHGIVPVLSTKADNVEGDYSRNLAMAQVAYDYHLPLWNFWAAVKDLPNRGLDDTRESVYLQHRGWDVRNHSALVLIDHIHRQLIEFEE